MAREIHHVDGDPRNNELSNLVIRRSATSLVVCEHQIVPQDCPYCELKRLRAKRDALLRLAKEATNGWACHAKRKIELDEIARLHREISKAEAQ